MFAARQSSAGTRRRTATWLVAAWLAFSVSQVFAACCIAVDGSIPVSTQAVSAPQHRDATAADDCCESLEQACQVALAAPPPAAALFAPDPIRHPGGAPVQPALHLPAASHANRPSRVPIVQAPPDPIYLRLQRFLI